MRSDWTRIAAGLLALVTAGSLEEWLPHCCGVGFPWLLAATVVVARRQSLGVAVIFALWAGAFEDALAGLPFATAMSFHLVTAVAVRMSGAGMAAELAAYPAYQWWIALWCGELAGSAFTRILLALPMGAIALGVVTAVAGKLERKAGIDV